jgi:hypothetical protein
MELFYVLEHRENKGYSSYLLVDKNGNKIGKGLEDSFGELIEQAERIGIPRKKISCLATDEILNRAKEKYIDSNPEFLKVVGERG